MGTTGSLDASNRMVIKGRFPPKAIEQIIRRYVGEYVSCSVQKSPQTTLQKQTPLLHAVQQQLRRKPSVTPDQDELRRDQQGTQEEPRQDESSESAKSLPSTARPPVLAGDRAVGCSQTAVGHSADSYAAAVAGRRRGSGMRPGPPLATTCGHTMNESETPIVMCRDTRRARSPVREIYITSYICIFEYFRPSALSSIAGPSAYREVTRARTCAAYRYRSSDARCALLTH